MRLPCKTSSKTEKKNNVSIPKAYICPITGKIMVNPVLCTLDGRTYEYSAIKQKLETKNEQRLRGHGDVDKVLLKNRALKSSIERFHKSEQGTDIPNEYICPITQEIMKNPVICTLDEQTYEYTAIKQWLDTHKNSPINRKKMADNENIGEILVKNSALKEDIKDFCANKDNTQNSTISNNRM